MYLYTTFRRKYVDKSLLSLELAGDVLDVGGKKENQRGLTELNKNNIRSFKYLNIDAATSPDFLASADSIPLPNESFDSLICFEVFEHLEKPEDALAECFRVLKKGGVISFTVPFLYHFHGDPFDFQRWTHVKWEGALKSIGFNDIKIDPMGSPLAVFFDLGYGLLIKSSKSKVLRKVMKLALLVLAPFESALRPRIDFTSGYFINASK